MQRFNTIFSLLQRGCNGTPLFIQSAGVKGLAPPIEFKNVEYPEKTRLRLMEKVPTFPSNIRPRYSTKKLRLMRGPEEVHNTLLYKQYGIVATCGGRMTHRHFELIRMVLVRRMKIPNAFAIWRLDAPWQPCTKKAIGVRMGLGKGSIHHYVTPVKAGRIIIEVGGNCEYEEVSPVLENLARRLPFRAKAVSYDMMLKDAEDERILEESNENPYTWKYMIQNNMGNCWSWVSKMDKLYFNKYR